MKALKRRISLCLVLVLLAGFGATAVRAAGGVRSGTCGAGVRWELDAAGTLTVSGAGAMNDYMTVYTNRWNYAPWYDCRDDILRVVVENGVIGVGGNAFRGCSNLAAISLAASVLYINQYAFYECYSLKTIDWQEGLRFIGWSAFGYCSSLERVSFPEGFTDVEFNAFSHCVKLSEVSLPDSVLRIGFNCFGDTAAYADASNWQDGVFYLGCAALDSEEELSGLCVLRDGTVAIAESAFQGRSGLVSVVLPDSLRAIGNGAFCDCAALQAVEIPAGVRHIGYSVFLDTPLYADQTNWIDGLFYVNRALLWVKGSPTGVTVREGTTVIAETAFCYCDAMTALTLPASLRAVSANAVAPCAALRDVYYSGTQEQWDAIELGDGNEALQRATLHLSPPDYRIAVYSTSASLEMELGESLGLGFALYDAGSGKLSESWKQMALVLSNPAVISLSGFRETEVGYTVTATGLREGWTSLTITDLDSGISKTIGLQVRKEYSQTRSFSIEALPVFYPQGLLNESRIETNLYDMGGLYVNQYSAVHTANGWDVRFDVYNSMCHFGAVDVYDRDGFWYDATEIEKFEPNAENLRNAGEQLYRLIEDFADDTIWTYEQDSFAKKTSVSIHVPEGGYFTISNNPTQSPGVFMFNYWDLLYQLGLELVDVMYPTEDMQISFQNGLMQTLRSDPEVRKALAQAFETSASEEIRKAAGKAIRGNILQFAQEVEELSGTLLDVLLDMTEALVNWKTCFQFATGVAENVLYDAMGPAGLLLKEGFKFNARQNHLMQLYDFARSINNTWATVYSDYDFGFINPYGIVFDTTETWEGGLVAQVFQVSGVETVLGSGETRVYSISFVKDDESVQPNGLVRVSIPAPPGLDPHSCTVSRQEADGSWTELYCELRDGFLVFETDHFSLYAVGGSPAEASVLTPPARLSYRPGDLLDPSGLTLSVNGETITSGYLCSPSTLSEAGEQTVTVRYGAAETSFTVLVEEQPIEAPSVSRTGGTLRYTLDLPYSGRTANVLIAWYDANGRMLGCAQRGVECRGALTDELDVPENAASCKLFQTDSAYAPMCAVWDERG